MNSYYYLNEKREPQGPHTLDELRALLATGKLNESTLAAAQGANGWVPLAELLSGTTSVTAEAGKCPGCEQPLSATDGLLPECCPACQYRLRAANMNDLWQNFLLAFRKSFVLRGRAPRIEYWSFILFSNIILIGTQTFFQVATVTILSSQGLSEWENPDAATGMPEHISGVTIAAFIIICAIYFGINLALLPAQITSSVRRLHDTGSSGWWVLAIYGLMVAIFISGIIGLGCSMFPEETSDVSYDVHPCIIAMIFLALAAGIMCIYVFILTLLDSQKGANQYGPSPKYPVA